MQLTHSQTKKILFFSTLILPILLLGVPFTQWGFKTDDWGNVYHAIIHDWQSLINFFTEGNSEAVYHPLNQPGSRGAFFQGLYRPMSFIYYFIQYCFFGTNPYGFFLVTITLHALNASLLFLIFCNFTSLSASFLAALFFAFHPSLWNWIGWTSAQTYFIELFVLLLILLALHAYLTTNKIAYYLGACVLYCANMFLKEQTIFFPLWVMGASYFYQQYSTPPFALSAHPDLGEGWVYRRVSLGFWTVSIFYIITRLYFFPLTKATGTLTFQPTIHSFITRMSSRLFDFVTYANDILGLSWLSNGNQLLKGSIIIVVLGTLSWLFIYNKQKKFIIFSVLSMLLFSWPALLMHYQPRYIYLSLPWSILIILMLTLKQVQGDNVETEGHSVSTQNHKGENVSSKLVILNVFQDSRTCGIFFIAILITFNACFLMRHLSQRQEVLHTITTAFQKLVTDQRTIDRVICFLALPQQWFAQGSTQAVWMLRKNENKPVYQFDAPPDYYITFTPIKNGFFCSSAHTSAKIMIDPEYLQDHPLFVVWDYKNRKFRILDEKPL